MKAKDLILFLCCVALRAKMYLAPIGVNEWGLTAPDQSTTLELDGELDYKN